MECRGALPERRARRCDRFHDVEPLAARLFECRGALLECRGALLEYRGRRCERFHDVEPLASRLFECRARLLECRGAVLEFRGALLEFRGALLECRGRRCERFHDVEPLASPLFECRARLLEFRGALLELRGALLECRGSRCERIRDVGPLASRLPRGAAPRSSRRASPDAQGHGPEPTGRAPDPTRRTPQRELTGRTEGRKRMRSNTVRPSALPVRSLGASSVPWDRGVPSFVAWRTGGLHRGRHGSGSSGVPRVGGRQREARRIVRKYWDARTLRRRPRRYWPSRRKTTPLSPSCRPGVPVLGDGPVRRGCLAPVAGLQATFGKRVASLVP